MNNLFQFFKIMGFSMLMAFIITSCNKAEEAIASPIAICDFVTINVTNSLANEIIDLKIDGIEVGNIQAGETINEICLDQAMFDMGISYPLVQISGVYEGVLRGEFYGICGVGVVISNSGVFDLEIVDVYDTSFQYNTL